MENKIGIILICTRKYDIFLQPLIDSAEKFFFKDEPYDVYLFTDNPQTHLEALRATIYAREIPAYGFPLATLYRYKIMSENKDGFTTRNLYYMDVDMLFVNIVGEEILPDEKGLVAVKHPGFYARGGWGDHETHFLSRAYLKPDMRRDYYAGGFQGGTRGDYLDAAILMADDIEIDIDTARNMGFTQNNGILARWHDETHWNHYLKYHPFKELTPEYCMVEEMELRKRWGIDNLTPRIIALKKDHDALRT